MSLFDSIFDKVSSHPTVDNLAKKLGIDKDGDGDPLNDVLGGGALVGLGGMFGKK